MGIAIGRIGDLAIVEHLGRATNFMFGYEIKPGYDVAPQHNALECCSTRRFHVVLFIMLPCMTLILATLFFFIFRYLQKNLNLGSGSWIGLWAIWYGVQRMILDTLRFGMGDATIGILYMESNRRSNACKL
jgi:prolipoprotein diacylglyceryltransferase